MSTSESSSRHAVTSTNTKNVTRNRPSGAPESETEVSPESGTENRASMLRLPTIQDVWKAQEVVRPHVYHTPLLPSRTIGDMTGARVYLKAENLQRAGSYKVRGATYKLSHLTADERAHGVLAASAGNHAQGVAIAAAALGIECTIVMPAGASLAKVTATEGYGATVVQYGEGLAEAFQKAFEIQKETGATFIHAFDDPDIISGQGTVGLEILSDLPDVEAIIMSVGGGGLISGVATAVKALKPDIRIYGVEAAGAASMRAALDAGHVVELDKATTVADGIATRYAGPLTYAITRDLVDDVVTVDDEYIIRAVLLLMERCKMVVEGAGAAGVAALLAGAVPVKGMKTAVVLSGGNIDMNLVDRFITHGLSIQGRYLVLRVLIPDRPGELLRLLTVIAEQKVNVLDVAHRRTAPRAPIQQVEVSLTLETRDKEHCKRLVALLEEKGFDAVEEPPAFDNNQLRAKSR